MTESVKSITQHHEPLRIFIAAESADETGKMARTICDASDIVVTGSATHAADVDAAFARECPADVLVCDVVLNGADMAPILERAKRTHPKLDILVVTACAQDAVVIRAVLAGATGYILKDSQENLLTSIRLLRGGGSPVSPTVARSVLRAIHARTITQPVPPKRDSAPPTSPVGRPVHQHADDGRVLLSQRESEIIMLLAKGISFSEIGVILGISPHTVTAHIKKIYKKLGVHSRGEAVYEATCMGLVSL